MNRFIFLLAFLIFQSATAEEALIQFEQANELYRKGDFAKAIGAYEQILAHGYEAPELYYNLGNAYFKIDDIPPAILAYERAKRLFPTDEDISYNLHLANMRVIDNVEPLPQLFFVEWWRSIVNTFSSDTWAAIGIVGLWCISFGLATLLLFARTVVRRLAFLSASISLVLVLISFAAMMERSSIEESDYFGIVFTSSVLVKSAPDEHSTDLFMLHGGVKVEVLDSVANWKKIRLADGKVGWLPAESITVI